MTEPDEEEGCGGKGPVAHPIPRSGHPAGEVLPADHCLPLLCRESPGGIQEPLTESSAPGEAPGPATNLEKSL